jgi:hypothetical protein
VYIHRLDSHFLVITGISAFLGELLLGLTGCVETEHPAVEKRMLSSPTAGEDPEWDAEWREYVDPDLRHIFQTSREVVDGDLAGFPGDLCCEPFTLKVPLEHLDAWIHSLNQARLSLAAIHGFEERDLEGEFSFGGDARALALTQVHFYGILQESFLRHLEPAS